MRPRVLPYNQFRQHYGFANVTHSGSITGTFLYGIYAATNAMVTNNAGAAIMSASNRIYADTGFANVTNSGSTADAFRARRYEGPHRLN
ncbi:hypothetical protein [Bradyrhizobium sp. URHD0069]|uniref:hypothetical protein n=1 Tax=Bradyrhizobium sp. URHD0069 TaxID=1380355 RepID=UPI000495FE53|nr:hypothetical protein [Bradyrhizobium sp. URHD0069]